ncbi:hypothetical protein AVEN_172898-1 [Araneus ventricosus]|uniref:Uncharacterized protein n=1 Tax=Araneus ventricosus TaxID=182803 RepID=A0A4Y2MK80_ARAVE|nr:hypothetical protein AVEN_188476-1 [Araneus ventricosus]GBN27555.1 hypothetical protein AVEN_172898-1 [Araneus ventricosus]
MWRCKVISSHRAELRNLNHVAVAGPASVGVFTSDQREDVWPLRVKRHFFHTSTTGKVTSPNPTGGTRIDPLACNRPHTPRIFNGIGFQTCDPPVPRSRPTTRPPRPPAYI